MRVVVDREDEVGAGWAIEHACRRIGWVRLSDMVRGNDVERGQKCLYEDDPMQTIVLFKDILEQSEHPLNHGSPVVVDLDLVSI